MDGLHNKQACFALSVRHKLLSHYSVACHSSFGNYIIKNYSIRDKYLRIINWLTSAVDGDLDMKVFVYLRTNLRYISIIITRRNVTNEFNTRS